MTRGISSRASGSGYGAPPPEPRDPPSPTSGAGSPPATTAATRPVLGASGSERGSAARLRSQLELDEQQTDASAHGESRSVRQRRHENPSTSAAPFRQDGLRSSALAGVALSDEGKVDELNTITLHAFLQKANAHSGNTELTKAYCHDVLTEVAAWLKQQRSQPGIRSLADLQKLSHVGEHTAIGALVEDFNSSGAVSVRMGGDHNQLDAIVKALAQAGRGEWAYTPVQLPSSNISREAEQRQHDHLWRSALAGAALADEGRVDALNTATLGVFRQKTDAHPGNTEVTKAYCHDVVTEVAAWLKQQPHQPEIRSLATLQNLWHSDEHAARTLVENFRASGAAPVRLGGDHDQLDAVLIALAQAGRGSYTPVQLPPASSPREVEQRQHNHFQDLALAGGALADAGVVDELNTIALRVFRRRTDMHPGNTEVTKAYCHDVVTEVAAWLKQQPHQPEIRSLATLQNLWHSDEHAARTLVENFRGSGAAPVRMGGNHNNLDTIVSLVENSNGSGAAPVQMGGNHDQLEAVLIALAQAGRGSYTPVQLPPAYGPRGMEQLLHSFSPF